jgi:hypothetical protein
MSQEKVEIVRSIYEAVNQRGLGRGISRPAPGR